MEGSRALSGARAISVAGSTSAPQGPATTTGSGGTPGRRSLGGTPGRRSIDYRPGDMPSPAYYGYGVSPAARRSMDYKTGGIWADSSAAMGGGGGGGGAGVGHPPPPAPAHDAFAHNGRSLRAACQAAETLLTSGHPLEAVETITAVLGGRGSVDLASMPHDYLARAHCLRAAARIAIGSREQLEDAVDDGDVRPPPCPPPHIHSIYVAREVGDGIASLPWKL